MGIGMSRLFPEIVIVKFRNFRIIKSTFFVNEIEIILEDKVYYDQERRISTSNLSLENIFNLTFTDSEIDLVKNVTSVITNQKIYYFSDLNNETRNNQILLDNYIAIKMIQL